LRAGGQKTIIVIMLKTIVFVTCAASAAASPALRSNLLETANGELALGSAAAGAAKGDPQCAGRSKERLAPTEEGVAASALWCLCNTEEQVIKKLENCENKGGDKAKHCMFDAATETCVPRGGAAAAAAATTTAAPTEAAGGGANSVPEPGCSKKGLMPCGTGLFGLPREVEHDGTKFCCPAAGEAGAAGAAGATGATGAAGAPSGAGGCAFTKYWSKVNAECTNGQTTEAEICAFAAKCASEAGGEQLGTVSSTPPGSSGGCAGLSGKKDECCAREDCGYSGFNVCLTMERLTTENKCTPGAAAARR
jgi:hypothetical protein